MDARLGVRSDGRTYCFTITCRECDSTEDVRVLYHQEYVMIHCHECGATAHRVVDDIVSVGEDSIIDLTDSDFDAHQRC